MCACVLFSRTLTDLLKQQGGEVSSVENATANSPSGGRANGISARMLRSRSGEYRERACTHIHDTQVNSGYNTSTNICRRKSVCGGVSETNTVKLQKY